MLEKDIRNAAKLRQKIAAELFIETWSKTFLSHKPVLQDALVRYYTDLNTGLRSVADRHKLSIIFDYTKHEMFLIKVIAEKEGIKLPNI